MFHDAPPRFTPSHIDDRLDKPHPDFRCIPIPHLQFIETAPRSALTDGVAASGCCAGSDFSAISRPITTRTGEFLAVVRAARSDQRLVFQLHGRPLVAPGYHVTEVKAVTYETMDCGGLAARGQETIIQLWNPGDEADRGHMPVGKFLALYDRVAAHVAVRAEAELRFEFGDASRPASAYHIEELEDAGESLFVHLRAPVVACKARDRERLAAARNADGGEVCCRG